MSDKTPTDEQLAQWLYDAEYDWSAEYYDYEAEMPPMPSDTFPHYYSDDYHPTLAAIFRELIESRAKSAEVKPSDADLLRAQKDVLDAEVHRRQVYRIWGDQHSRLAIETKKQAEERLNLAQGKLVRLHEVDA